jgi:hypothetical protein
MSKVYVGDVGTVIVLDCKISLSAALSLIIVAKKPNGDIVEWTAEKNITEDDTSLKYAVLQGDLDIPGTWELQAKVTLPTWEGLGDTSKMRVYERFN